MATQNRRDFFKTAAFIGATAATLPIASTNVEEKSKLSQDQMSVSGDTAISNDFGFYKIVCLCQRPTIRSVESIEYSIVLILILRFRKRNIIDGGNLKWL